MSALEVAHAVLLAAASALAVPALVQAVQCLLGSAAWRDRRLPATGRPLRLAVLIPAHDEAAGIGATIANVQPQLLAGDRLLVIADNCADDTAAVARQAASQIGGPAAFEVIERHDANRRGKGFALASGRAQLLADPPDVVVCIDADCRVVRGSVRELAAWAAATGRPVQADYLLAANDEGTPLGALSAFAVLVRNRVRPRGMARLGAPCQITGSGMALPWERTAALDRLGGDIVEDLVLGIEAALAGHPPIACPEVQVRSVLPAQDRDALRQRRRWEHGQLGTALAFAPRLLMAGLRRRRPSLVAMALDLLVPPLALLVALLAALALAGLGVSLAGAPASAAIVAGSGLVLVAVGTFAAWTAHARALLPWPVLLRVPFYVAWKLPLYAGFLRRRERTWQRTRRDGDTRPG
jgi:cellulose synthase/poly-beta-1,6-N-acetylglucosamine synthase-like glycosyltransferase